jgi:hypothetical protein
MDTKTLVDQAVTTFAQQTGLQVCVDEAESLLQVELAGQQLTFFYDVRRHGSALAQPTTAPAYLPGRTHHVVITPHITAGQAQALREAQIGYLDVSGNAYLTDPAAGLFVWVQGVARRPDMALRSANTSPTTIRLLYVLLADPTLLQAPYRTLAGLVKAALGGVAGVFADLQRSKLLYLHGAKGLQRIWAQPRPAIVRQWVERYAAHLRPKLLRGRYRLPPGTSWEELVLSPDDTWWGGEPAAHYLLDGYLRPELLTLYTRQSRGELIRQLRLRPDPQGPLTVLEAFEPQTLPTPRPHPACVYPLLAYADLMISLDPRNQEVAQRLYERYLAD